MFTKAVVLNYMCPNCKYLDTLKRYTRRSTITNIIEYLFKDGRDKAMRCFNCSTAKPMQLISMSCELSLDVDDFGIPITAINMAEYPTWTCENNETHIGPTRPVYPIPLKRAYKINIPSKGLYAEIISGGYPWKCPTCGGKLYLK